MGYLLSNFPILCLINGENLSQVKVQIYSISNLNKEQRLTSLLVCTYLRFSLAIFKLSFL